METTFWGSGRALLIYSSEWQLTREVSRLGSMLARVKLKGIDGSPHKRWSMWFNSMQHEEPYQGLTCREGRRNFSVPLGTRTQVVHGCRQLVMRIVLLSQITSATLVLCSGLRPVEADCW